MWNLRNRLLQDMAIRMYKKTTFVRNMLRSSSIRQKPNWHSLTNKEFVMPNFNTTSYGKHFIRYIAPKLWSPIPKKIRDLPVLSDLGNVLQKLVLIVFYVLHNRYLRILLSLLIISLISYVPHQLQIISLIFTYNVCI